MPELPEIEVTRLGLLPHILGRRVVAVRTSGKKLRQELPKEALGLHVLGHCPAGVDRRGKYLFLRMDNQAVLTIHLGMSGRLGLFSRDEASARHDHLVLGFEGGLELRLSRNRRFGLVLVWPPEEAVAREAAFTAGIGAEPLEEGFDGTLLMELAQGRRLPVKQLLMDSRRIAGIGNIYANEALFLAGIHPACPANRLDRAVWERLAACCRRVLKDGIAAGGASIADFLGVSGESGYFQLQLRAYGRDGRPCPSCGQAIERIVLGGRASFFCPRCQVMRD